MTVAFAASVLEFDSKSLVMSGFTALLYLFRVCRPAFLAALWAFAFRDLALSAFGASHFRQSRIDCLNSFRFGGMPRYGLVFDLSVEMRAVAAASKYFF